MSMQGWNDKRSQLRCFKSRFDIQSTACCTPNLVRRTDQSLVHKYVRLDTSALLLVCSRSLMTSATDSCVPICCAVRGHVDLRVRVSLNMAFGIVGGLRRTTGRLISMSRYRRCHVLYIARPWKKFQKFNSTPSLKILKAHRARATHY